MFIHFFDHTTALPMGTTQHYEPTGNNKLYLYDPLSDSNDPPPKVRDLLSPKHKIYYFCRDIMNSYVTWNENLPIILRRFVIDFSLK